LDTPSYCVCALRGDTVKCSHSAHVPKVSV